tara:strand:- start:3279 stop:3617 length:339 start_codon:yes stop_codon:yes gene_type:complete
VYRGCHHSTKLKQSVLTLFEEGLTATQVAKIINKRFRSEDVRNLSRCAALGIKWRAGKCEKSDREYNYPVRRSSAYNKSLAFNEIDDKKIKHESTKDRLITTLKGEIDATAT